MPEFNFVIGDSQAEVCITGQDVLDFNPCLVDQICVSTDKLQDAAQAALELIERLTNKNFCPEYECRKVDGTGTNYLYFKADSLYSLSSISYTSCTNQEIPTENPVVHSDVLYFDCCDFKFPKGYQNITVCGFWGVSLPLNVKNVAIQMALESTHPGITGLTSSNGVVESARWRDFAIQYSDLRNENIWTTGFVELDKVLEVYIDSCSQIGFDLIHGEDNPCNCKSDCYCERC